MIQELMDELKASIRDDMPLILEGKDPYQRTRTGDLPLREILLAVCKATKVSERNIAGPRLLGPFVRARNIFFHIAVEFSGKSPLEIGVFLNRERSTVSYSCNRATYLLRGDSELREAYNRTRDILNI